MRGKIRRRYYLEKSEDAGLTYQIVVESNSLEELQEYGNLLDLQPIRWVIKDRWTRSIVDMSSQHLGIISSLTGRNLTRSSFEPFTVPESQIDSYESYAAGRRRELASLYRKYLSKE